MPWLVSPHDEPATRWWMEHVVLAAQRVWVAQSSDRVLGFAALAGHWLEQLYVDPEAQAGGVGRALLDAVKDCSPEGLMLHVFTRNVRAPVLPGRWVHPDRPERREPQRGARAGLHLHLARLTAPQPRRQ